MCRLLSQNHRILRDKAASLEKYYLRRIWKDNSHLIISSQIHCHLLNIQKVINQIQRMKIRSVKIQMSKYSFQNWKVMNTKLGQPQKMVKLPICFILLPNSAGLPWMTLSFNIKGRILWVMISKKKTINKSKILKLL